MVLHSLRGIADNVHLIISVNSDCLEIQNVQYCLRAQHTKRPRNKLIRPIMTIITRRILCFIQPDAINN